MTDFGVNDRAEDTYMVSSIGTGLAEYTIDGPSKEAESKFSSYGNDDRPVKGSGRYDFGEDRDDIDFDGV